MRILINHLTRMHAGHICVAGTDLVTRRHVRPVLAHDALPFYMLARYGGPFDLATVVDVGWPRAVPVAPHVEDHVFVPTQVRVERLAAADEFWSLLKDSAYWSLREIFGATLCKVGNNGYGTEVGQGRVSLGFLLPATPPELYVAQSRGGRPKIRIKFNDGQIEADASVTDLRLFGPDHATPDSARVRAMTQGIADSREVILGVGLTRKFRPSEDAAYRHWLQVNNIHLRADPTWRLG